MSHLFTKRFRTMAGLGRNIIVGQDAQKKFWVGIWKDGVLEFTPVPAIEHRGDPRHSHDYPPDGEE